MKTMKLNQAWLQNTLPEGLPVPSSTVLTGPMGSGKPILALAFISSWLKRGGGVVAAPLQFPDPTFISGILQDFYDVDVKNYQDRFVFVQFDLDTPAVEEVNRNQIKANLVHPKNWDRVIDAAEERTGKNGDELMFFSTALNLPLFSPTYRGQLMDKFQQMFRARDLSYVFCVSTSMLKSKALELGGMADNHIKAWFTGDPKTMRFKIIRMRSCEMINKEVEAPFPPQLLENTEKRSEKYKVTTVLPRIRKI